MVTKSLGSLGKNGLLTDDMGATNGTGALVTTKACSSAAVTSVASATGTTTLALASPGRKGLCVFNDSSSALCLKAGAGASASSFTVKVAAGGYFEMPHGYSGMVTGAWVSANGAALVTDFS